MNSFKIFFLSLKLDYYQWRYKKNKSPKLDNKINNLKSDLVGLTNKIRAL